MSLFNDIFIQRFIKEEFSVVHREEVSSFLDLGCGSRPYASMYQNLFKHCVAADFGVGKHVDVRLDAARLPFSAGSFDFVLLSEVIEHVPDPQQVLSEISRVLKPGGRLLITWPFNFMMHELPHDYSRLTGLGMARLLQREGLQVERVLHRGNAIALSLVLIEFFCLAAIEACTRAPVIGRVFSILKMLTSRVVFGSAFRLYMQIARRLSRMPDSVMQAPPKGIQGYLAHWTLGYCVRAKKRS